MAQTRGVFAALYDNVDKSVFAIVGKTLKELTPIWRKYFIVDSSDRKFERNVSYAMFGVVPLKPEGQDYSTQLIKQGYTKDFTHLEFGLAFCVTQTAQEDDVYDVIDQYATGLARGARVTEETYAAAVLNNGFTSEKSPDGQALFAAAHPLVNGGTARNLRTADLTWLSLQQALIDLATDQKSEEGFFTAPMMGLQLIVPPALMLTAQRIVASKGLPGVNDNDINPINSEYSIDIIVNPYLGASAGGNDHSWFLLYKGKQHGIMSYTRVPIGMQPPERLPMSGDRFYAIRFRRSWGAKQWQGSYGNSGS